MAEIQKPLDINKIWAVGGDVISPSDSKIQGGWLVEIPPRQWFNWLDNKQDTFNAHVNQHGIAVWDATTEYQAGKSYVQGSNGLIYKAVQTNTNQNPVTDVTGVYWSKSNSGGLLAVRYLTTSGTYTPTPGTSFIIVEVQGAGGAGGGAPATSAGSYSVGAGGASGGYARKTITSGFSSVVYTVGTGGAGVVGASGGSGGSSSFGAFVSATGGIGGNTAGPSGSNFLAQSGNGGNGTGGDINISGTTGFAGIALFTSSFVLAGFGGSSVLGHGGFGSAGTIGGAGTGYGAGGGGSSLLASGSALAGGAGSPGIVVVWEYN